MKNITHIKDNPSCLAGNNPAESECNSGQKEYDRVSNNIKVAQVNDNSVLHDVSADLDEMFGKSGTESRKEAEAKAKKELCAEMLREKLRKNKR